MTSTGRISLLSIRGRAALAVAIATIVAVLAGPVMPAHAAPAPAPLPGPAHLLTTYPVNGFYSMVLSWDAAAPHSSEDITVEAYELRYADHAGRTVTTAFTARNAEFATRSTHVSDLGYDPTLVELRAGYSDDSVSEWAQLEVTFGSLAHLSAEIDLFADEQGTETTTLSSRLVFEAALARANALVAEGTAVGAPVGAAYDALFTAAQDRTNYSGLVSGIERVEAEGIPVSTPALLLRLSEAFAASRALLRAAMEDPSAQVTGEAIERSVHALGNAYYAAVEIADPLAGLLAAAEAWLEDPSAVDYTSSSRASVRTAVTAAHTALNAADATSDSLDAAAETVEAALAARLVRPSAWVDALALYDTLDTVGAEYTSASAAALATAHAAAVAADVSATATTDSLTGAGESLSAAIAALVDLTALRATVDANNATAMNRLLYTTVSWNDFARAYADAATFLMRAVSPARPLISVEEIAAVTNTFETTRQALIAVQLTLTHAPGLSVHVLDGQIFVGNPAGWVNLAAGQFGYTPSVVQPPVLVPTNPGLAFTPPPSFSPQLTIGAPSAPPASPGEVDCTVRRVTYCNRMAAPDLMDVADISEPAPMSARSASLTTGTVAARAATPMAAAVMAAAPAAPAAAAVGSTIVTVLPPTTPANGKLNVAIALPADALTGTLAFQYTYNGVSYETASTIDIVPPLYAYAVGSSSAAQLASSPAQLARSGADSTTLFGGALALIALGALLGFRRPRRTRQV